VLKGNLARLVPAILRSLKDAAEQRAKRATEEELHESNERFRMIFEHSIDAILLSSADDSILTANPEACRVFGMSELEIRRVGHAALLDPEDSRYLALQEEQKRTGRCRGEITMKRGDGSRFPAEISSALFTVHGGIQKASMIIRDMTQHNKLEELYRQAQKMEAVGQLAGGVAHDFNNILSAIFGYSHLIMEEMKEEPVKSYVEEIMKASKRAEVLTQSLLSFSRKQAVTLAVIDLGEVIKGLEAFLCKLVREDIELKINRSGEPLAVLADRGQIEQVIMNLVANARDAMPNGGELLVETLPAAMDQEFVGIHGYGKEGAYALISVSDSGFGMDKETQLRIFEPFFTTKEQGKGTGLGLSMAYGIVKKHDGFIKVSSEPGIGTTFKVYLPRVTATAQAGKVEIREVATLRGGAETILVGEDDPALRRLSTRVLSHYGYRVIEAVDGQDAVDKFVEYADHIDLVILDAIMPKKNGREACLEMKVMRPGLKTVFVSGYTKGIFAEDNTLDENAKFIQKPVSPEELLVKIRELLDKN
jgi:PAS domain S-box-containing protein